QMCTLRPGVRKLQQSASANGPLQRQAPVLDIRHGSFTGQYESGNIYGRVIDDTVWIIGQPEHGVNGGKRICGRVFAQTHYIGRILLPGRFTDVVSAAKIRDGIAVLAVER